MLQSDLKRGHSRRSLWWPTVAAAALFALSIPLPAQQGPHDALPESPLPQSRAQPSAAIASPDSQAAGSISGTVVDASGAAIESATVRLTRLSSRGQAPVPDVKTDKDGVFVFTGVGAGTFQLTVTLAGFSSRTVSVSLSAGQIYTVPQVALEAAADFDVEVGLSRPEVAQLQLDTEERHRLFGVVPNFYVSYVANAAPLTPKQKFTLAGKFALDPISFGITGITAGIQQANNTYPGYGDDAAGYGKRYAAATGTLLTGTLIGGAILPSVLKQDPRYFYKGTGSVTSRVLYATAMAVMCKGDNGRWQVNYSAIIGGLAASGIANAYYPAKDRDGVELTFANAAIGTAESAAGNIVQEFLFRKLTSHTAKAGAKP